MGRNKYLYITLLTVLGFHQEAVAQIVASTPKLVISITIDQLRSDFRNPTCLSTPTTASSD